jgi:hypothetical protein
MATSAGNTIRLAAAFGNLFEEWNRLGMESIRSNALNFLVRVALNFGSDVY